MADNLSLTISENGIQDMLSGMLTRAQTVRGWLNRVAYPQIIQAQRMRWMTEGASEGDAWAPLNPKYARYKLKKYASYPGSGQKMLIATNRLVSGMTGDNPADHYKLVTDTSIEVGTTIGYASYVNEKRDIITLSDETIDDLVSQLGDYVRGT